MAKVLIVEDDVQLSANLTKLLVSEGFTLDCCNNGRDAQQLLGSFPYDIVVLDWQLPDISGIEVARGFRKKGGTCPILMLTGKSTIDDKETGFEAGVDDYLTKPFEPRELIVRLHALLRRATAGHGFEVIAGNITINVRTCKVTIDSDDVVLRPKEFALLELLARNPGQFFSSEAIRDRLWEADADVTLDAVRVLMHRLRKSLPDGAQSGITYSAGKGYKLDIQ